MVKLRIDGFRDQFKMSVKSHGLRLGFSRLLPGCILQLNLSTQARMELLGLSCDRFSITLA